jgi:hypothetical protein
MRPLIALIATVLPSLATAEAPLVLGHIKTQTGGKIVFTSMKEDCPQGMLVTFLVESSGQVTTHGCYRPMDGDLVVVWNDDQGVYAYPFARFQASPELKDYAKSNP